MPGYYIRHVAFRTPSENELVEFQLIYSGLRFDEAVLKYHYRKPAWAPRQAAWANNQSGVSLATPEKREKY